MTGIYLHIPYCRKACHYCNFHFSTKQSSLDDMIKMIAREIFLRRNYAGNNELSSIYFGGGTPSILSGHHLEEIFEAIIKNFKINSGAEITLEANPDDITDEAISVWKKNGINRLSIGAQTFDDRKLKLMNRSHSAVQTYQGLEKASGHFDNYSVDLIFSIPHKDHSVLTEDLKRLTEFSPPHISAYSLTIEEKTVFHNWTEKGYFTPAGEEFSEEQFNMVGEYLAERGYEQYEISNYAKPGAQAVHNSSYWKGASYIGIGPGAHSFNGTSRESNISNNSLYIKSLKKDYVPSEKHILTKKDLINEYILTRIRTTWGMAESELRKLSAAEEQKDIFSKINSFISSGLVKKVNSAYVLTKKGRLFADHITEELFI